MQLPTERTPATRKSPRLLTLFGQSKVGKTTTLATLDNCLIIDTEQGTEMVDAMKVSANSLQDVMATIKALRESENKYDYIALDTIDNIVNWMEDFVCQSEGVKTIGDLDFGKGYAIVRDNVMKIISQLKPLASKGLILIGHRKKTLIANETDIKVNTSSLDLSGKLKNFIMADSDAIGYVFRDAEGELKVSFVADDETEAGARCPHLRGQVIDFDFANIYVD
jgi:energy-coupling factor transporter ATP-binding protein EcfA2